jgi:hypothetical protein
MRSNTLIDTYEDSILLKHIVYTDTSSAPAQITGNQGGIHGKPGTNPDC